MDNETGKLIKVTFEYEKRIDTLEGEVCEEWMKVVNGVVGFHQLRGNEMPELEVINKKWKKVVKSNK